MRLSPALLLPPALFLLLQLHRLVPGPFMDEPFFLDTMQHHQAGQLSYYNPYITTFPGLFLLAYPFQKLLSLFGCPLLFSGRLLSFSFFFFNLWLLQRILAKYSLKGGAESWANACCVMVMPLQILYYVFIYTDPASIASLLLAFYFQDSPRLFDLSSLLAVLVRQNNIVWVVALSVFRFVEQNREEFGTSSQQKDLSEILVHFLTTVVMRLGQIIRCNAFQIVLILALGLFGYLNGGFVLHHSEHHALAANPMQVLYSQVVLVALLTPALSRQTAPLGMTYRQTLAHPLLYLLAVAAFLPVIHWYTFWHPFNLSDNRHYVFYVQRYLFRLLPWFKYCLALVYPLVLLFLSNLCSLQPHYIQLQLFCLSCVNVLAVGLSPLIEPRYYIQSVLFFNLFLHLGTPGRASSAKTAAFLLLDVLLCWVLLYRPFGCQVLGQWEEQCRFII